MRRRLRKGIFLLPTSLTVANLFCGFWAIIGSMQGKLELAAMLIGMAILFDLLDGRVARMANATSEFGKEFDSLADVVSFGVAPGVMLFAWGLHMLDKFGWSACFLFVICGTMRLARFNIQETVVDKKFFVGLPIPAAAGVPAALVFMFPEPLTSTTQTLPVLVLVVILALLMVSTLRYYSFKDFDLRSRQSYMTILFLALLFVAIGSHPQTMFLALSGAYMMSGPALKAYSLLRRGHLKTETPKKPLPPPAREELDG